MSQFKLINFLFILAIVSLLGLFILSLRSDKETESEEFVRVPTRDIMTGQPIQLEQDDNRIINYILKHGHLQPPSGLDYNLTITEVDPSRGQGQFIRKLLGDKRDGFFVECGGLDGETRSNTLYMERNLNWRGLLVEADPENYAKLQTKNRKAWSSNTCLAVKPYPHTTEFLQSFSIGKILERSPSNGNAKTTTVQCMPLFSLLTAMKMTTIDYFSLDVEGSELKVLKTIPFDKVLIKILSVEIEHSQEGKDKLLEFMEDKGYRLVGQIGAPKYSYANDFILVHSSVTVNDVEP